MIIPNRLKQFSKGKHWCSYHKEFHPKENFGNNRSKKFGLDDICKLAKSIKNAKRTTEYQRKYSSLPLTEWNGRFEEGVYKIVDTRDNSIAYIGSSNRISYRYYDHFGDSNARHSFLKRLITAQEKQYFKFVFWIEETNRNKRLHLEAFLTKLHDPRYNILNRSKKGKG